MSIVDEAVQRLSRHAAEDERFIAQFGRWERPRGMPRYPLNDWLPLVVYGPSLDGAGNKMIEGVPFLERFPEHERSVIARVMEFVYDEFARGKGAGDKTLRTYRLALHRRLEALGF